MKMLALRPYQREAVDAVTAAWAGGMRRPAVVLPTGAGKTVVFAHLISEFLAQRGGRALVVAHRTELIEQAAGKVHDVAPELSVGIVKAARNETLAQVVVGSVQTLRSEPRRKMLRDVGLVVVDEAHHAVADSYLRVLEHFGCLDECPAGAGGPDHGALAMGCTATMSRGDKLALGKVWEDVVYSRQIAEMIQAGWLVRPRGVRVKIDDLDLSRVRVSGGDFREGDLGAALQASMAPETIAKALLEHASGRPTLLFAPTVESATVIADAVRDAGLTVGVVHGEMPPEARRAVLDDFRASRVQVVCNCMVLTEGTDLPLASCVVIARPTTNAGLYVQMVGRVLRPHPGKDDALVIDVVGASERHALASFIELFGDEPKTRKERDDDDELDELESDGLGLSDDDVYATGPIVSVEVDLFHGSSSAWLRTYGGTWFIPAGDRYIAIIGGAEPHTYDVVAMDAKRRGTGRWVIQGVSDLSYAMAWAEGEITVAESTTARKERSWRRQSPSPAQTDLAGRLGLRLTDDMTKGEVSELISVTFASRRIDATAARWAASLGHAPGRAA